MKEHFNDHPLFRELAPKEYVSVSSLYDCHLTFIVVVERCYKIPDIVATQQYFSYCEVLLVFIIDSMNKQAQNITTVSR